MPRDWWRGTMLKAARTRRKLTQAKLAEKVGVHRDPAAEAFAQAAPLFGLKPEDYGRVFTAQGTAYRLVGINLASCQHAIEAVRLSDGQRFAFANTGFPSLLAEQGEAR